MKPILILVVISVLQAASVFADVSATRVLRISHGSGAAHEELTLTQLLHGSRRRDQSHLRQGSSVSAPADPLDDSVVIIALDAGVAYKLDQANQVYEEIPLKNWVDYWNRQIKPAAPSMSPEPPALHLQAEFHLQTSSETRRIHGYRCQKSLYDVVIQTENPENHTRQETRLVNELWTNASAPALQQLAQEQVRFRHAYVSKLGSPLTPEERQNFDADQAVQVAGLDEKELSDVLGKVLLAMENLNGVPVRWRAEWSLAGRPFASVTTDLIAVHSHPLASGLFRPPRGYNKIPSYNSKNVKHVED